jgi:hypothetical protein
VGAAGEQQQSASGGLLLRGLRGRGVSGLPSGPVNSEPTSRPRPRTSPITGVFSPMCRAPSSSWRPRAAAFSTSPSSWIS